jgi:uroporphyrinogen decarboxylase
MQQLLMDYVENPGLVHELVELCLDYDLRLTNRAIEAGVDIVVLGDDYADKNGPMMSPKHFAEFILPGLRRAIDSAREAGAYVIKHSDGNLWPVLDMIVDAGPDAINPIEPAAGMDIGEVKRKYGNRVCIVGNIDCGDLLCHGTPEMVRQSVKECIEAAAPGGGFMLASSNSIHSSVRPENYLAMAEACREFGAYE